MLRFNARSIATIGELPVIRSIAALACSAGIVHPAGTSWRPEAVIGIGAGLPRKPGWSGSKAG